MAEAEETLVTQGTIHLINKDYIVAMCMKSRLFFYLSWKGTELGYRKLRPGMVVNIYHTAGFSPKTFTIEATGAHQDDEGG